jgi:hypothetical protein
MRVGDTISCSTGTWTGPATGYEYQWQRSPDGATDWTNIAGATSNSYTATIADRTRFLRCQVTAFNLADDATASSNVVGPVEDAARPWSSGGGQLGCGTYEALVLERGGGAVVAALPWTNLEWSRVLDDTSEAKMLANGYPDDCCAQLAGIRPWRHELALYRDGALVWVGPITLPKAPPDQFAIDARDLTAWWDHRLIHEDHEYAVPTDLATIFQDISDDAMAPDPSPGLSVSTSPCGVDGTMSLLAVQHLIAGPKLRDLANIGVDYTAVARTVLVGGTVVPTASIGTFEDGHFATPPTPRIDGTAQANAWLVRGNGGGAAGDTVYGYASDPAAADLDGLLESSATVSTIEDNSAALAAAQTRAALTEEVVAVENCVLAPTAPFAIEDLVAGAVCELALSETCIPVSGSYRLQKVAVSAAAPDGEKVTLTFQPLGTTG